MSGIKVRIHFSCGHKGWLEIPYAYISKESLFGEIEEAENHRSCPQCAEHPQISDEAVKFLTDLIRQG